MRSKPGLDTLDGEKMFRNMLKKAIHKSQHVQRNWDLSKTIPQEDLDLIAEAVTVLLVSRTLLFSSLTL